MLGLDPFLFSFERVLVRAVYLTESVNVKTLVQSGGVRVIIHADGLVVTGHVILREVAVEYFGKSLSAQQLVVPLSSVNHFVTAISLDGVDER